MRALAEICMTAFVNLASWNVARSDASITSVMIVEPAKQPRDALGRFVAVTR
jgi:hypothetical protein